MDIQFNRLRYQQYGIVVYVRLATTKETSFRIPAYSFALVSEKAHHI